MRGVLLSWDADGLARLSFSPAEPPSAEPGGAAVDLLDDDVLRALEASLDSLEEAVGSGRLGGVVVEIGATSLAVGTPERIHDAGVGDRDDLERRARALSRALRRLETLGRPLVAAICGPALDGALCVSLACHRRIGYAAREVRLGFPAATLGLLPGAGGLTRAVRLVGVQRALADLLVTGRVLTAEAAERLGLLDELAASPDEVLTRAREWIGAAATSGAADAGRARWDVPGYAPPGGVPGERAGLAELDSVVAALPSSVRRRVTGTPYPAPPLIVRTAVEGASLDLDSALDAESNAFAELAASPATTNLVHAYVVDTREVQALAAPQPGHAAYRPSRVAVLGAGMMGAGIAAAFARAGGTVVMLDVDQATAERGRDRIREGLDAELAGGRLTAEVRDDVLGRIAPTGAVADVADCDLLVEAVFEDPDLKKRLLGRAAPLLAPDALVCSNTSTLPIFDLATAVPRPDAFLGLHFFSPVDKMPLVEIIRGAATSDEALARGYDIVRLLRKTPIAVHDSRGFFTSRVFGTLVMEGAGMLAEGIDPETIERAASVAGFPAPPLAMIDEISLTLCLHIRDTAPNPAELAKLGGFGVGPGLPLVDRLVHEFGRAGRAAGAGFYDYPPGERKRLWPGLTEHFVDPARNPVDDVTFGDLQERLLFVMAIDAARCLEEGVLRSTAEANVGSILGIGFPALYGGALHYIATYADPRPGSDLRGVAGFTARARELAAAYGDRFAPPASL